MEATLQFRYDELVLYGIRELAWQHYEALDHGGPSLEIPRPMRVDQAVISGEVRFTNLQFPTVSVSLSKLRTKNL